MSYAVCLTPDAEGDLARLPALLASYVLDRLELLAENPVALSKPPSFPHPLYQKYQFFWPSDGPAEAHITILFHYSQDETTLHIFGIGIVRQ